MQLSLFPDEPRPLAGCVTPSWHAWTAMQRSFAAAIAKARDRHGRRSELIRARTALVHAALAGRP